MGSGARESEDEVSETEQEYEIDPETGEVITEAQVAEAEEAESEPQEGTPDSDASGPDNAHDPDTPAPEDSQAGASLAVQERELEAQRKKMVKKAQTYAQGMVDILGPDLGGFVGCPLCADFYPGFRLPIKPEQHTLEQVRVAIGLEPGDNLPKDNYSRVCTSCDGWGYTDSGSKVPGQAKLTCYDCAGRGWVPVGNERESGSITAGNGHAAPLEAPLQDNPSNDPPEVARLKQLGYVVVAPIEPVGAPNV